MNTITYINTYIQIQDNSIPIYHPKLDRFPQRLQLFQFSNISVQISNRYLVPYVHSNGNWWSRHSTYRYIYVTYTSIPHSSLRWWAGAVYRQLSSYQLFCINTCPIHTYLITIIFGNKTLLHFFIINHIICTFLSNINVSDIHKTLYFIQEVYWSIYRMFYWLKFYFNCCLSRIATDIIFRFIWIHVVTVYSINICSNCDEGLSSLPYLSCETLWIIQGTFV